MNDLPDDVKALLKRGDPAHDVTPRTVARVAARLEDEAAVSRPSLRPLALGLALLASAALGSAGTVALSRVVPGLLGPAPAPLPPRSPVVADPVTREAALLEQALEALNRHDTAKALSVLDERARQFPAGVLESEARVLRVRVLLERDDPGLALAALERLPDADLTPALRLSWARLLASRGSCEQAIAVTSKLEATQPEVVQAALGVCAPVKGQTP